MKKLVILVLAICFFLLGLGAGHLATQNSAYDAEQSIVTMSWGDGKYGKSFYGAEVYLAPTGSKYSVRGRIWIGRGNNYSHDLGELGIVATPEEAVAKWGVITWTKDGLTIGPGDPKPFVFSQAMLESHR